MHWRHTDVRQACIIFPQMPGPLARVALLLLHTKLLLDRLACAPHRIFPLSRILISFAVSIAPYGHKNIAKQEKWAIILYRIARKLLPRSRAAQESTSSPTGGLGVTNRLTCAWRIASARPGSNGIGSRGAPGLTARCGLVERPTPNGSWEPT